MLLITGVTWKEVLGDPWEILQREGPEAQVLVRGEAGSRVERAYALVELVKGRRFVRPSDGMDVVIGTPKAVQSLIGIQFEAHEAIQAQAEASGVEAVRLSHQLFALREAGFWLRLRWLFTGVR